MPASGRVAAVMGRVSHGSKHRSAMVCDPPTVRPHAIVAMSPFDNTRRPLPPPQVQHVEWPLPGREKGKRAALAVALALAVTVTGGDSLRGHIPKAPRGSSLTSGPTVGVGCDAGHVLWGVQQHTPTEEELV